MTTSYSEKQKFTQWWLWMILIGLVAIPIYGIYQQVIVGQPFGSNPMPDVGLFIFLLLTLPLIYLFWAMKLTTDIDETGLRMKFNPFTTKQVTWNEVQSVEVVDYGFVGWGVRVGSSYGTIYNTGGSKGLAVRLKNGNKFCIGTRRANELRELVSKFAAST